MTCGAGDAKVAGKVAGNAGARFSRWTLAKVVQRAEQDDSIALAVANRIDLVLIGARGQVGSALRHLLSRQLQPFRDQFGIELKLIAAFDRRGFAFDLQGLEPDHFESAIVARQGGAAYLSP